MAEIELETGGALATVTLNRPDKRNALTLEMWRLIPEFIAAAAEGSARAVLIQGHGGCFSAGADIGEFEQAFATAEAALANQQMMQAAMQAIEACDLPVLAMINGVCVGGGCNLALACDMRWAAPSARFAITPARLGLAYGIADTKRLVAAVGVSRAKEMLFTARALDAETAMAWGLVDRLVAPEALDQELASFADALAGAARYSLRATKRIARKVASGANSDDAESRALFAEAFSGEDFAEGYRAFLEKRAPRFS
jgi:enoyl-CoA hydratase/carnithine racemase